VIFVNNTISGAVIFTSLTVASPMQGLLALLGCSSSIASALLLKLDSDAIRAGLHGYNGVLIG
jgi:urea transporter